MKNVFRLALTLVMVSSPSLLMAQNSALSLVEEGRTWRIASLRSAPSVSMDNGDNLYKDLQGQWHEGYPYEIALQGDTVMNDREYKSLIRVDKASFICGLRQDGDRVYACYGGSTQEEIQFDFSLKVGDVFCTLMDEMDKMVVGKVDTVSVDGRLCKRLLMYAGNNQMDETSTENIVDIWVEGIGCMNGPHFPFWWTMIGNKSLLIDCRQGERVLATTETFTAELVSTISHPSFKESNLQGVKDLQGRVLKKAPQKGIYIRDGKKILYM